MSAKSCGPALFGKNLLGEPIEQARTGRLAEDFLVPPFSVLNARDGWWQDRKRAWLALGIESEIGRGASKLLMHGNKPGAFMDDEVNYRGGRTSVFDPVLCELIYRWFTPDDGQVVDPFAGGSVRGIVASLLGRRYWGSDLSQPQIDANYLQADKICPELRDGPPLRLKWVCGDSMDLVRTAPQADFLFSCPPYGDLERYSDDPRDLSTMSYGRFMTEMKRLLLVCWGVLKMDRFAAFVVGDFRDSAGHYHNFVGDVVSAFQSVGFKYMNEVILVTCAGSLPLRTKPGFQKTRKLGKTHQNILVFVKGDAEKAAKACGKV